VRDSVIDEGALVEAALLEDSLVGRWAEVTGAFQQLNLGDSSTEAL